MASHKSGSHRLIYVADVKGARSTRAAGYSLTVLTWHVMILNYLYIHSINAYITLLWLRALHDAL